MSKGEEKFCIPKFGYADLQLLYQLGNINPRSIVGQRMLENLTFGKTIEVVVRVRKGKVREGSNGGQSGKTT